MSATASPSSCTGTDSSVGDCGPTIPGGPNRRMTTGRFRDASSWSAISCSAIEVASVVVSLIVMGSLLAGDGLTVSLCVDGRGLHLTELEYVSWNPLSRAHTRRKAGRSGDARLRLLSHGRRPLGS